MTIAEHKPSPPEPAKDQPQYPNTPIRPKGAVRAAPLRWRKRRGCGKIAPIFRKMVWNISV
ncbi:hypothetical protein J2X54_000289 [Duganella sp. 3397]|nr:hypothetical protein [Duganella sp. 3397]